MPLPAPRGVIDMGYSRERGMTLIDVMTGIVVMTVLIGMAVPLLRTSRQTTDVAAAARFLLAKATATRARAVLSGSAVGLVFRGDASGVSIRTYIDGDGDGVRTIDISDGVDRPIEPPWRLEDSYPSARLALQPSVPFVGRTQASRGATPVALGRSGILTFSPLGTSSSGTVYVSGARSGEQYAVRVLGITGRTRLLRFHPVTRVWGEP